MFWLCTCTRNKRTDPSIPRVVPDERVFSFLASMYLFICIDESLFNLDVVSCNLDLRKLIVWRRGSREAEGSEAPRRRMGL